MIKSQRIEFVETKKPIHDAITKFGGQPVWHADAQWPLSRTTGNPMRFICQIALDSELFGAITPAMAYLFMTDEEEFVDGTWRPDGGENAVILQPGSPQLPVINSATGPTLYRMVDSGMGSLVPEPCEFEVTVASLEDPEFVPENERAHWSETRWDEYADALGGNKIGGTPIFVQSDELPRPGGWKLFLQLDSTRVPFFVNFGDAGIGYGFLSDDGSEARFLWQCA